MQMAKLAFEELREVCGLCMAGDDDVGLVCLEQCKDKTIRSDLRSYEVCVEETCPMWKKWTARAK